MSERRLLIAPDSFKGTFTADEVAAAIGSGAEAAGASADLCPLADGGEGTAAILLGALGGEWVEREVTDPLGRPVTARFALLGDGETAALDTASASGLPLVAPADRDAERASTRGTGELIAAAIKAGATNVLLGAGGSATTDGGAGAIAALEEAGGIGAAAIEVLCDVREPFERAPAVFAPQKGADPTAVARLEKRLDRLAVELPRDPRGVPMTGCAGGLSGGLWACFGATLVVGADRVLDLVDFDARLARADAVATGEGRLDAQSLTGKVVGAVATRTRAAGRPCHAIVGGSDLSTEEAIGAGLVSVTRAGTLDAMAAAGEALAIADDRAAPSDRSGDVKPHVVEKPWGSEVWWAETSQYAGKLLNVTAGNRLSLQLHRQKDESSYVLSGRLLLTRGSGVEDLTTEEIGPGFAWHVEPGTVHTIEALEDAVVLEVSTPHLDDVVRLADRYGRED